VLQEPHPHLVAPQNRGFEHERRAANLVVHQVRIRRCAHPAAVTSAVLRESTGSRRDAKVSLPHARDLGQLDNPAATATARRALVEIISQGAYTARFDIGQLERVVRAVFEPGSDQIRRAVGHTAARGRPGHDRGIDLPSAAPKGRQIARRGI